MLLIIGLGNPGKEYEHTRHNIGFRLLDAFLERRSALHVSKPQFKGELKKEGELLFLKPATFMNLSGESAFAVASFFKPEKILVIHDDLDLPFGAVRLKFGGSSGGHNGLKSLDQHLGNGYYRVRIGIAKPSQGLSVADYVLAKFRDEEEQMLATYVIPHGVKLLEAFTHEALGEDFAWDRFVSRYSFKLTQSTEKSEK
ncbi:MAG: aminoacyl-tRNA hydrolase [Wolinella sp.]